MASNIYISLIIEFAWVYNIESFDNSYLQQRAESGTSDKWETIHNKA